MSETRNDGPGFSRGDDPFAELFDMIEQQAPSRDRGGAHADDRHRHAGGGLAEPAAAFDYGHGDAAASPPAASPRGPAPSPYVSSRGPDGLPARRPFYSDDESSDVGVALAGLCQPAQPRLSGPAETARLAPDRFTAPEEDHASAASSLVMDDFDALIAGELAALKANTGPAAVTAAYEASDAGAPSARIYADPAPAHPQDWAAQGLGYDEAARYDAEPDAAGYAPAASQPRGGGRHVAGRYAVGGSRRRRAMFFGGGVAAVALVGLFGAFAGGGFSGGLLGDGEPVLIRADTDPVKMAPTDPGGRVVPNQNKAVYQRVAGAPAAGANPAQNMLITASEEPLDISFEDEISDLPGVMVGATDLPVSGEVQVAQADIPTTTDGISSVLQPHRVRTYEVRPDGTLVPRTEPAGVPAAADPVEALGQATMPFSVEAPTQGAAPIAAPAAAASTPSPVTPTPPATPPAAAEAPAADPAPAEAVAATEPAPAPAAAPAPAVPSDAFFVQISSQPSEALAQDSMQTMATRFASAIGGRQLMIQPAEIEGRGTFYRVRVVAASRDEANSVCVNFQSAGGSCFVTR